MNSLTVDPCSISELFFAFKKKNYLKLYIRKPKLKKKDKNRKKIHTFFFSYIHTRSVSFIGIDNGGFESFFEKKKKNPKINDEILSELFGLRTFWTNFLQNNSANYFQIKQQKNKNFANKNSWKCLLNIAYKNISTKNGFKQIILWNIHLFTTIISDPIDPILIHLYIKKLIVKNNKQQQQTKI